MAKNLIHKGRAYYCMVSIPRPLRHLFLSEGGKPKDAIWEALGKDHSTATIKCAERVAYWMKVFARLQAGESLDDIKRSEAALEQAREGLKMFVADQRERGGSDVQMHHVLSLMYPDYASILGESLAPAPTTLAPASVAAPVAASETVSHAAAAMYDAMERDENRQTTIDGHRLRVRAFVEACGDVPLASITRATASDWLDKIGETRSNRTRNAYAMTMALVIETARKRGRYQGENPFDGQKRKAVGESYQPFTEAELRTLFAALPREIKPAEHTPETALPWVALIAAYSGARLEEIAQLTVADIRDVGANGSTVTVIDIHNGGINAIKNAASVRLVPVHSELVRAGLLRYVAALPKGSALFPGLVRRASKGGKIGARLGELFRKRLIALGLKRAGVCFHSFRHTVGGKLEQAGVAQTDAARVLGHDIPEMTFGTYSTGPGLKRLAAVVEEIRYEGVAVMTATTAPVARLSRRNG
jgi:integrase